MAVTPFGSTSATQWGIRPQIVARSTTIAKFASSRHKSVLYFILNFHDVLCRKQLNTFEVVLSIMLSHGIAIKLGIKM